MKNILQTIILIAIGISYCSQSYGEFKANPERIVVGNVTQLYEAVQSANQSVSGVDIVLEDGQYQLQRRINLSGNNINIYSQSGDRSAVIIAGHGMTKSNSVEVLFDISGSNIRLAGLTLEKSSNHLIQIRAENNADNFVLSNCVLRDSYEQMLKVSAASEEQSPYADNGLIENCLFEYSEGVGPQYYIGGIDAHRARGWQVKNNTFRNIASPAQHVAEHAIHFWRNSAEVRIVNNTIIDCDRGIGLGLGASKANQTFGGFISNNVIINTNSEHQFSDAAIIVEASSNIQITNNVIYITTSYPNAIEYRYPSSQNTIISNNTTNKAIKSRDGAQALLQDNQTSGVMSKGLDTINYYINRP